MVPPFDHPRIVAGQGTVGLEIIEAAPDVETVLVPLSGGGLAAGVAAAVKASSRPSVIGVSMERGAAMKASLDAGRPVLVEELPTLADSLGGGIGLDNRADLRDVPRPARRRRAALGSRDRRRHPPRLCRGARDRRGCRRGRHRGAARRQGRGRAGRSWCCSRAATSTWRCTARIVCGELSDSSAGAAC